jgi:hypothetical protein
VAKKDSADKKHVGDVIGLGRSKVKAPIASKGTSSRRRVTGIELPRLSSSGGAKRAGVVGGVRGRGR